MPVRAPSADNVEISRPGKLLFPEISKADLAGYYRQAAEAMLPYLRDRPLALARYPDGIDGQGIFAKNVPPHFPDWIGRVDVPKEGGTVHHLVCRNPATLVYLANQAVIELHPFLSRVGALHCPDQLVIDLDPPSAGHFPAACRVALLLRDLLTSLGLTSFVKTTGGKGLHVQVPLDGKADFDEARRFASGLAGLLAREHPDLVTTEQRRNQRGDRIYADIMRNAYAQTAVVPYSVRARPGAPVATPLHWQEVGDPRLRPDRFTLRTVPERIAQTRGSDDPWAGMPRRHYGLATPARKLARLAGDG
jgi:bifunctional non-homologous end joining protein LigD